MSDRQHPGEVAATLQGHAVGLVDTPEACAALTGALNAAGFSDERIEVLSGDTGLHQFRELMEGSHWGESVEKFLKQGTAELELGHSVVSIAVSDEPEAAGMAALFTQFGGHSLYHFGKAIDTRLTA